ncbi:DNA mismatch repair protein [Boeremia exigua]|uniref:DNA mismatch repair protein n=1 Tax=Boeremia exigua TaxID=749465 RepID=UPI001E8CF3C3|nr:DNA mismatch repair protein [Boeremia exigua]KAH6639395.1 DNA mismatch repair protein [Boeremia exigua]
MSTMSIRPLPDDVVAQIKSATAVVSLGGVVLELLKNSLDAKASRINVTVDFARGACVVEDDGLGIPPTEFSEDGGLGKLYCTSKFQADGSQLGQYGTFLASLSAVSLLNITSHHHAYRSQNSITFHHAQTVQRQIPALSQDHVHGKHGTRVTVRNLFGNMPVRVKQRAVVGDQKTEQLRLRNSLRRDTVGLLLSWQGSASLKVRDADGNTIVQSNTSNTPVVADSRSAATERPRSAHLSSLLQIMTQANYIGISDWASWVPTSASTPAISVKGAISLEPAPNKHAQFISFGLRPLFGETGGNELYDQVNRMFALSSFGSIEDDVDVDEQEKLRRLTDRRYKNDGYTNRQLKARKGVDRYPMFHLRIVLKDRSALVSDDRFIEDESNLHAVVDVLSAMVTQWLSVHHFCPRKLHQTAATSSQCLVEQSLTSSRKRQAQLSSPTRSLASTATNATKKQKLAKASLEKSLDRPRTQAFADWSRIKSGKSSFFETRNTTHNTRTSKSPQAFANRTSHNGDSQPSHCRKEHEDAASDAVSTTTNALSDIADETVPWTDPSTNKAYHLNARTGCVMPPPRSQTGHSALSPSTSRLKTSKLVRLAPKFATAEPAKSVWLNDLLRTWDNPIFKPSEQAIQRMSLQDGQEQEGARHRNTRCSHFDMQEAFNDASSTLSRLSKDALRGAEVISQVDKKFVLVKMAGLSTGSEEQSPADTLVLIDQHAADERVQVELLLSDLCSPVQIDCNGTQPEFSPLVAYVVLEKSLHFAISSPEHKHFDAFRANFADWGILYDISSPAPLGSRDGKETCKLSVTALPPSISERCKTDPELLVSFLRSAVWAYVESPPCSLSSSDRHSTWVKKIATCPAGLVDMINSRACRSAIMFNDELSLEECKVLVGKLADCVFPFMCAHGRPSMVPIADMGRFGSDFSRGDGTKTGIVDAWKRWRR